MTDLRTAAQQALEAWDNGDIECFKRSYTVMENLRAALAQQAGPVQEPDYWQEEARRYAGNADYWRKRYEALAEPVEPVAWVHTDAHNPKVRFLEWTQQAKGYRGDWIKTPLYTAPPRQTDPQIEDRLARHGIPKP